MVTFFVSFMTLLLRKGSDVDRYETNQVASMSIGMF
jgi:hypothetical protein